VRDVLAPGFVAAPVRIVAVDGPSGSGKSTLAGLLAPELGRRTPSGAPAPIVAMDDLYPGWHGLGVAAPMLVDLVLRPLSRGLPSRYRRFEWPRGRYGAWVDVAPRPWVIVEGVASGSRACAPFLDAVVWVEADRQVRLSRGLARDGEVFAPHWHAWAVPEERVFAREGTRGRARFVVDGDPHPQPQHGSVVLLRD
jgi:hypothetical protein